MKIALTLVAMSLPWLATDASACGSSSGSAGSRSCSSSASHDSHRAKVRDVRIEEASTADAPASASDPVLEAYLRAGAELAADRAAGAAREAGLMAESARAAALEADGPTKRTLEDLAKAASRMKGKSIDADRKAFLDASKAMIVRIDQVGAGGVTLRAFHCPMYPGSWLQEGEQPANPYYGSSMLRCGKLQSVIGPGSKAEQQADSHDGHAH